MVIWKLSRTVEPTLGVTMKPLFLLPELAYFVVVTPSMASAADSEGTICLGGGRVYFIESRNPSLKGEPCGQQPAVSQNWTYENGLWSGTELYLVALDADTGTKLWEKNIKTGAGGDPVVVDGKLVIYMLYAESGGDELLVLSCSKVTSFPQGKYYVYTYNVSDSACNFDWQANHNWDHEYKVIMKRPAVIGDTLYLYPNAYSLSGGTLSHSSIPEAGCGVLSAIGNTLCGRFGTGYNIGMWNVSSHTTSSWVPIRPGCWINIISGGNMLLMPENSAGCSCHYYFMTSVGFVPSN